MKKGPNTSSRRGNLPKLYNWHDGHGKVHSRPKRVRSSSKPQPSKPQSNPLAYLNQPMGMPAINKLANTLANAEFAQPIQQLQTRQAAVAPWFQNYLGTLQAAQTQNQNLVQPLVTQAQQAAQNTGKPVLDPNSDAAQNDALAAAGRSALQQAAADQLGSILAAGQTYLSNQQAIAPQFQQQVSTDIANQLGQLTQQRGAKVAENRTNLIDSNRQYGLNLRHQAVEDKAFQVNTANTLADNAREDAKVKQAGQKFHASERDKRLDRQAKRRADRVRNRGNRAKFIAQYGIAPEDVADGLTPAERKAMQTYQSKSKASGGKGKDGLTPYQRRQARKERNNSIGRIQDVGDLWGQYHKETIPASKGPDGNIIAARKPTDDDVRSRLEREGYSPREIRLALAIKNGALRKGDIQAAKRLGIWPLPKDWRDLVVQPRSGGKPSTGAHGYPSGPGSGQVH